MIERSLFKNINFRLFSGKTILLLGARQVGKTTLMRQIQKSTHSKTIWVNADNPDDREVLNNLNSRRAIELFPPGNIVIIDEAQRLENSGLVLKIIHDNCESIQLIASGSSSFELTDKIKESLTGRKWTFKLFPISFAELVDDSNKLELERSLSTRLIFGSYPEVINRAGDEKAVLQELFSDYLFKDVFRLKDLRKPDLLEKLVQALAFQIGNQVSYRELSSKLQVDVSTIERYIHLLEEAYVIFRLPSFARNLRNELKRSKKIFFVDNGIRNAAINQFNPLELRNDVGALWENILVSERLKYLEYNKMRGNMFFWRTSRQQEVDYLEEYDGKLFAYEFKWHSVRKVNPPISFSKTYPEAQFKVISKDNYSDFVL